MDMTEDTEEQAAKEQGLSDSVQKVQTLLKARDDTSRFVGLAVLKSVLDNSAELRNDQDAICSLWGSIPPKFIDRLLRTGSSQKSSSGKDGNAKDMLDLAVSVLHTFTALLPDTAKSEDRLVGRIPQLVSCLVQCSDDTTRLVLETLAALVSQPDGARVFMLSVDDVSPLTEMAPSQPLVLDIFGYAWLNYSVTLTSLSTTPNDTDSITSFRSKLDSTIGALVSSFKGTDAVTLSFLGRVLPSLTPALPQNPSWIPQLIKFVRNLATSRPNAAARTAYTNLAAALLETYPSTVPPLLFSDPASSSSSSSTPDDKPFSYLFISLLLIDIRASLPTLLSHLNSPTYPQHSQHLSSAFNILSQFIGYLIHTLDSSSPSSLVPSPDLLLKLRKSISETMSLTIEYLRDRWDGAVAGAMGLHPDAIATPAKTSTGSHLTLSWDSQSLHSTVHNDPLILAAIRALAIWLREDDNDLLRKEAAGLMDMFAELYRTSSGSTAGLDFRRPILVALEGLTADEVGVEALLTHSGWETLTNDLTNILLQSSSTGVAGVEGVAEAEAEAARGMEIVRILLPIVEAEDEIGAHRESWMDLVTHTAAFNLPDDNTPPAEGLGGGGGGGGVVTEFWVAVLQLVTSLLAGSVPGMRRRYTHSIGAIIGIASQIKKKGVRDDDGLQEALDDVLDTLTKLR
ncbi:Neurochondrin-domain-containing protein [Diplogelasinospora grovesii]|uniref:Neurochondrin-domain-containing protein n=1 Tax=Diplogelasinospora grovesii TaxID=303347 RepID=A0AAN6S730_9PEZI|nr:Neurochondrin-domain-containing protein [Diplogelasinospora grovesii]